MKLQHTSLALMMALAGPALAADAAAPNLTGLWSAKLRYGPDVRGPLILSRDASGWRADLAGYSVPARLDGGRFTFTLPDGRGAFRGVAKGSTLRGQWTQEKNATGGLAYATPVTMKRDALGRWRGDIIPLDDSSTYFLPLRRDGSSYSTLLSNPERNQGRFAPIRRIELAGKTLSAFGGRQNQPERLVLTGQYNAEDDLLTLPLRGATVEFARDPSETSPFYPRARSGERYRYRPPLRLDDGWPVASLASVGISTELIEQFIQRLIDTKAGPGVPYIHSVLIARHGKLVLEEYFHGFSRYTTHDIRSAGKSMTATMIGAAMLSGMPITEDTPIYRTMLGNVPTDLDPRKQAMTLRHLMTMTSGYFCDDNNDDAPGNEDRVNEQTESPEFYPYILKLPMSDKPGDRIVYCSANALLAGGVLRKISGEPLPELFERLVARPLQMGSYHLNLTPAGELYTAGGGYFTPRDFMKLPQMMLNGGTWNDRRIVSADWVRKAGAPLHNLSPQQQYGYFWNSTNYHWKGHTVRAVFAAGNGSQIFMEIPELDLVIAFTGGNYGDPSHLIPQRKMVPEDILPAVQ